MSVFHAVELSSVFLSDTWIHLQTQDELHHMATIHGRICNLFDVPQRRISAKKVLTDWTERAFVVVKCVKLYDE